MGSVWRATNLQLEAPVAIKLLRPGQNSGELVERLRIEARAAAKLVHPGIVRMFDIGESETGEPFIVMELLNGESLSDLLRRGPLSAADALKLLLPIAEALALAHSRGVVHRDLKPDNIFVSCEGESLQPKLLDFGIAKVTSSAVAVVGHLTQSGTLLGSPDYMSPEQAYGSDDIDHRSDLWSFCVVLYEAIAGKMPFEGANCHALLRSIIEQPPLPLANADAKLWSLLERGLAKARAERPACMSELGRGLAEWLTGQGVHEDATGASVETKWLSRAPEPVALTTPRTTAVGETPESHRAAPEGGDATLVSVVHPAPRLSSEAPAALPVRRRAWGALLTATAALALAGSVAWSSRASWDGATAHVDIAPKLAAHPQAAAAESPPPPPVGVAVETLPVERAAPAPRSVQANATSASAARPAALTRSARSQGAKSSAKLAPPQPSLPQSLPTRDTALDLMEPY